jgi:hypothetical protein
VNLCCNLPACCILHWPLRLLSSDPPAGLLLAQLLFWKLPGYSTLYRSGTVLPELRTPWRHAEMFQFRLPCVTRYITLRDSHAFDSSRKKTVACRMAKSSGILKEILMEFSETCDLRESRSSEMCILKYVCLIIINSGSVFLFSGFTCLKQFGAAIILD